MNRRKKEEVKRGKAFTSKQVTPQEWVKMVTEHEETKHKLNHKHLPELPKRKGA